jgi:hypothetical protein
LQLQGAQLQRPGSQEQGPPFWQLPTFTLALRFFDWRLRFVFIVIDFFVRHGAFPALLPGLSGRSPALTDIGENHYTPSFEFFRQPILLGHNPENRV